MAHVLHSDHKHVDVNTPTFGRYITMVMELLTHELPVWKVKDATAI